MKRIETGVRNQGNASDSREYNTAFIEELCSGTWKEVYRFIYYKVGNREEAEDITQETYAKALDYLKCQKRTYRSCHEQPGNGAEKGDRTKNYKRLFSRRDSKSLK